MPTIDVQVMEGVADASGGWTIGGGPVATAGARDLLAPRPVYV